MNKKNKIVVLSVGGSLIVPGDIDTKFLKNFRQFIKAKVKLGHRFIIVCGGGSICRTYQNALAQVIQPTSQGLDLLGIAVTGVNARLVQQVLGSLAHPQIINDPDMKRKVKEPVLIGCGYKPGRSTDDIAVHLAVNYDSSLVVNLTNIDYVYDSDPRKNKQAKPIKQIRWTDYLQQFDLPWKPGDHVPFDPVASRYAKKHRVTVVVASGYNLSNVGRIIAGQSIIGTILS